MLAVVALSGCGSQRTAPADREWKANARGVALQLRADVVAVAGLDRLGEARAALHDDSQLYGLLVSYTDFGGCRHMVAALGVHPPHLRKVQLRLDRACVELEAADVLFTRAVARDDPALLVRATTAAVRSLTSLDGASLALRNSAL